MIDFCRWMRVGTAVALFAAVPLLAAAGEEQSEAAPEDEDARVEELERRVDLLTEELERLRADGAVEDEANEGTAAAAGRYGLGPAASKIYRREQGVSIGGYGEWLYEGYDGTLDDGTPSGVKDRADFLRLVLYTGYKFDDRILFNSEIEFEHASTEEDGEVSVEFAYLDFFVRPQLNVRTGLVAVPVGIVNEIHEPPAFLGARRPDVERSILPTTWRELGAGIFGDLGPVSYRAYLTTSLSAEGFSARDGIRGGRQAGSEAEAEDLAVSARVDYSGLPGLLLGVSTFRGGSGQGESVAGEVVEGTVTTLDVHGIWNWRGVDVRGLWARVDVDDAEQLSVLAGETIGSEMEGWYLQAGFDALAATRLRRYQLIPFVRVEKLDTQAEVPAALAATVTGENDRSLRTYGLVFKPSSQIAVKFDYQDFDNEAGTGRDQINVGVGFAF